MSCAILYLMVNVGFLEAFTKRQSSLACPVPSDDSQNSLSSKKHLNEFTSAP